MKIIFKIFLTIFVSTSLFANTAPEILINGTKTSTKNQEISTKNMIIDKKTNSEVSINITLKNTKPKIPTVDKYVHIMNFEMNTLPKKPPSRYPDININGQYEGKFSGRDYNPKLGSELTSTDPLWDTIRNDPVYKKLPNDVLVGDPKLEVRYNVQIDGKLDKDLTVHFDVEQEPEFNGKYDVQVTHKKSKLKFHNFDVGFQQGAFINVNRALNGVMYGNDTADWEGKIAQGQLRSTQQRIQVNGNNKETINLGRTYILPGSVKIWKNNKPLRKTSDYTVDHYKGAVTFSSAPTNLDVLNIVYEFTNPIADLIPVLNKKNFLGVQYKYRSKEITDKVKKSLTIKEKITITKDENSKNINNVYFLKNTPIILGSDSVLLNNVPLYKNKDYFLKTHTGKIKFVNIDLNPSDNIEVAYSYYQKKSYEETLIGSNSPGWYKLKNPFIIDGSTKVFLGQIEKFEGLDYIIDYDKGRLRFNYPIEYPTVIAVNYNAVETKELSNKNKQRPFEVGVTYLNEYVKTEDEEQFKQVVSENVTISNNIITLQNNPLTTTADISLELNNTVQDPSAYTVDLYKGEIRFNDPTIGSAKVSYKYKESFRTKYQFQITRNDNVLEFENNSYPGFYLQDTPVKFNGKNPDGSINYAVKEVRIQKPGQDLLTLSPGISFNVDFDDDGQNVILKFIKKSANNQSILEQENLPAQGDVITMIYEFTPNNASGAGNIDQKQYGLTLGTQLNKRWNFKADIAAASTNLSKPEKEVIGERLQGTGQANGNYTLSHKDIKEDSESVIISREGIRLTKGRDYIINYTTGIIKFINLTPSTNDTIFVDYTYYDNGAEINKGNTMAYASKFSSSYKFDHVKVDGYLTNIGDNYNGFTPLQANKAGSTAFGGNLKWRLKKQDTFAMNYNRNSIFVGTKDNSDKAYKNTDTLNTTTTLTFLDNIKTSHSTSYAKVIQDPLTTIEDKNLHATDTESFAYNFSTSFGPRNFKQTISQGIGESNSDILDQINPTETKTKTFKHTSSMLFHRLFLIGNTSLNTNYSSNLSRKKTFTIGETRITENLKIANTESKGIGTTIKPFRSLTGSFSYNKNNTTIKYIGDSTETNSETSSFSENYGTNYAPYTWLKTSYSHSRNESASPLLNQKNNRSTKTQYNLQRLGIRGLLDKYLLIDRDSFVGKWINNATVVYNLNKNIDIKNNDLSQFESAGNSWTLSKFQPIPGISFKSYSYSDSKSKNINKVETKTASENISISETQSQSGGLSYSPKISILNYLNYNLDLTEKSNIRESQTIARSSTGNFSLDTEKNNTRAQKLTIKPLNLKIGIPYIYTFNLGKLSASAGESFLNKLDETTQAPIPIDPNKTVSSSILIENQVKTILTYSASFSPFNILTLKGLYSDTDDKTTRDLIGVNYRLVDQYSLSTSYAFFKSFLTLGGTYENQLNQQYGSSQKNTQLNDLLNLKNNINRDPSIFSNSFENKNDKIGLSATLSFFKFFTINGSGYKSTLKQISYSGVSTNTTTRFKQNSASAGTSISPIKGMNIGYTYTLNETFPNGGNKQLGYGGLLTAIYKPLKTKFIDVNITYKRTDNWGKNFNTFEQTQLIDGTGRTVETQVVETDNTIENAAVNVNVNIPLNNSPYVDRIVIQGEGYVKKVIDRLEHQKDRRYSYDIGGIMIKGTLHF